MRARKDGSLVGYAHTRNFWKDWGTQAPDVEAIRSALENLRSQTRSKLAS